MAAQAYGETNASTTAADGGFAFGFNAQRVVVQNDKAGPVFVRFDSTTPSTGGIRTCSGEQLVLDGIQTGGCAVASQSTTTGTIVRVWAMGG
jgi:hypothetical protein